MKEVFLMLIALTVLLWYLTNVTEADTLQLKLLKYIDRQGTGTEAFRLLVPSDWQFEGGIRWVNDDPLVPGKASCRIYNPKGTEEFEIFPNQAFWWTMDRGKLLLHPVGSKYYGLTVHPPIPATEFIQKFIIPASRRDVSNLRVVLAEPVPELRQAALAAIEPQPGLTVNVDSGKVRIEYQRGGRLYEEEIYAVVESFTYPIQTMFGPVPAMHWLGDYLFSFKAEKGKLEAATKTWEIITSSFQLDLAWFNIYVQVVEQKIQEMIHQTRVIGEIGNAIATAGREIREDNLRSWQNRQDIKDRLTKDFCHNILGIQEYFDPVAGKPVELPNGYTRAWTNGLGDYIVSDSPSFNPGIGSNLNWQEMQRTGN